MANNFDEIAVENFRDYLRIPTVHPDVNYDECVKFLENYAKQLDLHVQVFNFVPKKPIVLMTWEGLDPKLPAILLNSHTDVVPVFEDKWTHPPFEAEMDEDGNIFARGTQDMKCVGIMYLEAIRRLKNDGIRLKRTVYLSFVPDEEIGGMDGMATFVKTPEFKNLNIGFAMDEGVVAPINAYAVFYGEKVLWQVHVHCCGTPGHGCSLHSDTPGEKLRHVINKFLGLRDEMQARKGDNIFPEDNVSSINLTRVYGGIQENVVPDKLTAVFDFRISIKEDLVKFEEKLRQWCREAGPNVEIQFHQKDTLSGVTAIDDSNPFWTAFNKATEKMNIKIQPITCPGNTDSRYLRNEGISSFGFTPINQTPLLLHAHDEFVNKRQFLKGIDIYCGIFTEIGNV